MQKRLRARSFIFTKIIKLELSPPHLQDHYGDLPPKNGPEFMLGFGPQNRGCLLWPYSSPTDAQIASRA